MVMGHFKRLHEEMVHMVLASAIQKLWLCNFGECESNFQIKIIKINF